MERTSPPFATMRLPTNYWLCQWSDYTASFQTLSRDGSMMGGTIVKTMLTTRMNMWRHRQKLVTSKTYSIGSFGGNTMVRQNSTDDEEEDPFQGETIMPT
eukprot:228423_1